MADPPPYSEEDLRGAFPEFDIRTPALGDGTYKIAYEVVAPSGLAVLKVLKNPAVIPDDTDEVPLPPRLDREIAAMKAIASRRVVAILDGPEVRNIREVPFVWYLEPYYAGGTLRSRMDRPWSEGPAMQLCDALLEGVEAMWQQAHLVHRDIKPENIVFDDDEPVLLDLGIALHVDLTPLTDPAGLSPRTVKFAAPEQFDLRQRAPIDARTDQFSIGIVAFEALTGLHPFDPDQPIGYFDRLRDGDFNRGALVGRTRDEFARVLARLLSPAPHQRFRTHALARQAVAACQ